MNTYSLHLHPVPYQFKPSGSQVGSLSKSITSYKETLTAQKLAEKLANGHTVVLGLMSGERKKHNLVSQQVLMLDFDNTKGDVKTEGNDYITIDDVLAEKWMQQHAAFVYKTFSYREEWQKFRVVILLDRPLFSADDVTQAYKWLMEAFPQADKSTKDASRIFYGGDEYIEINFNNTWTPQPLVASASSKKKEVVASAKMERFTDDKARKIMKKYIARETEHLKEYGNALSAITVLAKSVMVGEISEVAAREFVKMLAMGNDAWALENEQKLIEFLGKRVEDIYTQYTFSSKFQPPKKKVSDDKFDPFEFADAMLEKYAITYHKDRLFFKEDTAWVCDTNKLIRLFNRHENLKQAQDKEVMHQLSKRAPRVDDDHLIIQLANGYHIVDGQVMTGYTSEFTPYILNVNYDPKAYDEHVDNFLNFLTQDREDLRRIVEEVIGHILMLQGFPHKVFFFTGAKGSNGKSTFLEMLNKFVGDLGSNIALENFNDATSVAELEGKIVNIGDDIDATYMEKSQNFKTLASGNLLQIRPIYREPYKLKNRATLIFTANDMPIFKDKTGGIERRLVIIPCDNTVTKADLSIDSKLSTSNAQSYILNLGLKGMQRIADNGGKISDSETVQQEITSYLEDSDSVLAFISNVGIDPNMNKQQTYENYENFCSENGQHAVSMTNFTKKLKTKGYRVKDTFRMGVRFFTYTLEPK